MLPPAGCILPLTIPPSHLVSIRVRLHNNSSVNLYCRASLAQVAQIAQWEESFGQTSHLQQ
jgi:hypothetical protein